MYSYGDDFTYEVEGDLEYYTCLTTLTINEREYIVAENEQGAKRVFLIEDEDEEIISAVDEEDEEALLDIYERQEMLDGDFYTNDDDDFNKFEDLNDDEADEFDEYIPDEDLDLVDDKEIDSMEFDDIFDEIFKEEE